MIFIKVMTKYETYDLNVVFLYFIFITVKIACITFLLKIYVNHFNVSFLCKKKHAFQYSYTGAFTDTIFTNHAVLFVTFLVPTYHILQN